MQSIYLDYASTTPVRKEALEIMLPYFDLHFGNPSSVHHFGQRAIQGLDEAREVIARELKTSFRGVLFLGSATEANNLTLRGVVARYLENNRRDEALPPRIIISAYEHDAVKKTAMALSEEGCEVITLPLYKDGSILESGLEEALNERTVLVSCIHTSSETGIIHNFSKIIPIIRKQREENRKKFGSFYSYPLFHTDAVQGVIASEVDFSNLEVDLMTLSGHKIGAPKGIGVLAIRDDLVNNHSAKILKPIITGGNQEFGFRAGTENVPYAMAMSLALKLNNKERRDFKKRLEDNKDFFWSALEKICPQAEKNELLGANYSPHILSVFFKGYKSEDLLVSLDFSKIAVSYGSACKARSFEPSIVLTDLYDKERALSSLRFSFGRETTRQELEEVLERLKLIFKR